MARKPNSEVKPSTARLCSIPREQLRVEDLSRQIKTEGEELPLRQLAADGWQLEPAGVGELMGKLGDRGVPLCEYAGVKPFYGVKTGCNDAFLIDTATRDRLIAADPTSSGIIRPYLRGQDIDRWATDWQGKWMIFTRRGIEIGEYPAIKDYLLGFRKRLEPKPPGWTGGRWVGRKSGNYAWYEIQDSIEYWREFEKPKIIYQEIQYHPSYAFDRSGLFGNNKTFFVAADDMYLLAVLNSPLMWWHNWRYLPHMKDEALSPAGFLIESLPIAAPTDALREMVEALSVQLVASQENQHEMQRVLLDWLRIEHDIEKPSRRLQAATRLDSDAFVAEVKRLRGRKNPLSAAGLKSLRDEHARTIVPAQRDAAEAAQLEQRLSDLVNEAYGLTPEEVALMWKTAPPRMPIAPPHRA